MRMMSFGLQLAYKDNRLYSTSAAAHHTHAFTAYFLNGKWMSFFRCFSVLSERSCYSEDDNQSQTSREMATW